MTFGAGGGERSGNQLLPLTIDGLVLFLIASSC